ncbi:hypothetical protein [Volucribacter amazonae]|uniref:Tetratricopeptide repeat protein n=1 Tax=Volucribacter amazonae TaxID=256731 RepID=A0A9X4SIU8_9PAST|nr:hypothetical protein [Volucribacter amazonae]MDG6896055.1 hypothetical protein [Volucribacter amazonae]
MKTFRQFLQDIKKLTEIDEIENCYIQYFNEGQQQQNYSLLEELVNWVTGTEKRNEEFSVYIKMHSLSWLTHQLILHLQQCEEQEKDRIFNNLLHCLWKYKWFIYQLPQDVDLTKQQIENYATEMQQFYKFVDVNLAAFYKTLMLMKMNMGDVDGAKMYFTLWQQTATPDDVLADCEACEQAEIVNYFNFIGDAQSVLSYAEPILTGEMSCAEVPHIIYFSVINSLIKLGQWQQAEALLLVAIEEIVAEPEFISLISKMIELSVKLGLDQQAKSLAQQYEQAILQRGHNDPLIQLEYFIATAKFDEEKARIAQQLARLFDERNHNNYYSQYLLNMMSEIRQH